MYTTASYATRQWSRAQRGTLSFATRDGRARDAVVNYYPPEAEGKAKSGNYMSGNIEPRTAQESRQRRDEKSLV